jgi:hypothetical protein
MTASKKNQDGTLGIVRVSFLNVSFNDAGQLLRLSSFSCGRIKTEWNISGMLLRKNWGAVKKNTFLF